MSDGTLKKRCGFGRITSLPYDIRAFWEGYIGGVRYCFAVAGGYIYSITFYSTSYTTVGYTSTTSGSAQFFFYDGHLYLIDGSSVYVYLSGYFRETKGYIPLYGDGWSPLGGGTVNEPINCISPYIRVRYVMESDSDTTYRFNFDVESIYKIYVNGLSKPIDHIKFGTTNATAMLLSTDAKKGSEVIIYFRLANFDSNYPSGVRRCKSSVVYGLAESTKLFLYNGPTPRRVYYSTPVDTARLSALRTHEVYASGLYFTEKDYFDVGAGDGGITSMCTCDDKLFIFTSNETWYAVCDTAGRTPALRISGDIGCVSVGAAVAVSDGVITVMAAGVYKLKVSGSSKNVFEYEKISDPISDSVRASFFKAASTYYCAARGEFWLTRKDGATDKIWIYDAFGNWLCFTGMKNKGMGGFDGDVGFFLDKQMFACVESYYYDTDYTSGASIGLVSVWKSKPIDFGCPERRKKLMWATMTAAVAGGGVEITITGDNGGEATFEFSDASSSAVSTFSCRPHIGRARFVQITVSAKSWQRARVLGMKLAASVK
jgi:hypothetical protein